MKDTASPPELMTFQEAARLSPRDQTGELDAGRWVPGTKNPWRHGQIVGNAYALLREFARRTPGWSVSVGDPGTKLRHHPDVLRGPDVAIVRVEREPKGKGVDGWLEGAPDVAVEVVGEAQSVSELGKKALEYLAAGAGMVWVLDPAPRQLMLFTPPNQVRVLQPDETLDGGTTLPGFACRVAEFFE